MVEGSSWPVVDEVTRRRLSPVALKATLRIGEAWGLEHMEVAGLLGMTAAEFDRCAEIPDGLVLTPAQFDHASLLISIFGALGALFDPATADRWPRRPNAAPLFGGRSAVELMQVGGLASMKDVLRYLRAVGQGL